MKKPENEFKYPPGFNEFFAVADDDLRKKLAFIGYLQAKKLLEQLASVLGRDNHGKEK